MRPTLLDHVAPRLPKVMLPFRTQGSSRAKQLMTCKVRLRPRCSGRGSGLFQRSGSTLARERARHTQDMKATLRNISHVWS